MVKKLKSAAGRSPSSAIAQAVLKRRAQKNSLKNNAKKVEEAARKAGGYGKAVVSVWEVPKGGIEKSSAYRKLLTRVEVDAKGKPPPPEQRDGAPLKGGYPVEDYPPNVIVDGLRASWLPDDWAQVLKNTGPGGTYLGWMGPDGKFYYHRHGYPGAIEETLIAQGKLKKGEKLTVMHGLNGMMRSVRRIVKPGADKAFLQQCLTAKERKHVKPASAFHFAVISGRRATIESGQHDIMTVEGHFKQVGIKPVWYVDKESINDYKALGLDAKVGGKLTPSRNMALDDAKKKKKVCVEVSDDISKWIYYDCAKQDFRGQVGFEKANKALLGTKKHIISPLAAAQFMLAKMRSDEKRPHLAGVFPTANAAMTLGGEEFGRQHFILGDFFVAEPSSPCRFDNEMTLKEDYDYTCSHINTHGSVLRCNRMFLSVKHATNAGGAVSERDNKGVKERKNIAILQKKWPGVFSINRRRKGGPADSEVVMKWGSHNRADKDEKKKVKAKKVAGSKTSKNLRSKKVGAKVKKHVLKKKPNDLQKKFPDDAVLKGTKQHTGADYMNKRCIKCHNRKIRDCIGMTYKDGKGNTRTYGYSDLKYDIAAGRLVVAKR